jgi:hypothetical protein
MTSWRTIKAAGPLNSARSAPNGSRFLSRTALSTRRPGAPVGYFLAYTSLPPNQVCSARIFHTSSSGLDMCSAIRHQHERNNNNVWTSKEGVYVSYDATKTARGIPALLHTDACQRPALYVVQSYGLLVPQRVPSGLVRLGLAAYHTLQWQVSPKNLRAPRLRFL